MKTKKKQTKMVGRSALMASLIVAAITGVTPAFAADNLTQASGPETKIVASTTAGGAGTYVDAASLTLTNKLVVKSAGILHVGKTYRNAVEGKQATTLTVDNMSIENGGAVEVTNNSTLKIVKDYPLVAGTLTLDNGTVNIMGGEGTLQIAGNTGKLDVTGGINAIQGSVLVGEDSKNAPGITGSGTVDIAAGAQLNITKNLTVNNGTVNNSGTLVVDGTTSGLATGTITIASTGQMTAKKADFINNDNTTKTLGATLTNDGKLYLNMEKGTLYKDGDVTKAAGVLGGTVNFLGGTWQSDDGKTTTKEISTVADGSSNVYLNNTVNLNLGTAADVTVGGGASDTTLGAKTLETNATALAVGDKGTLQLTGDGNGALIGGTGTAKDKAIEITTGGTLELGIAGNATQQGGTLVGIDNKAGGTVNVTDGTFSVTNFTNAGDVTIDSYGQDTIFTATNTTLTAGQLDILNSTANLGKLTASGGSIFVDPATVTIKTIAGTFGSDLVVGAGGNVVIGDDNANWMLAAMNNVGVSALNPATSVLAVRETVKLATTGGVIYLDPTATDTTAPTQSLTFKNGSLVIADMENLKNGVIFDLTAATDKKVSIADGAKLYLTGLQYDNNGQSLILGGTIDNDGGTGTGWTGENGFEDSDIMLNASFDRVSGKLSVGVNNASDVMPGMSSDMNGLMGEVWYNSQNSVNSGNAGKKLVSRAADSNYMTPTEGARVVEGAARMAVVGATQQMAFATSNAATAAATQRTSMANPMANSSGTLTALVREEGSQQWKAENSGLSAGNGMKNGAALWIMPLYQNMNAWNMKADNFNTGYSANFGGVALGGDYTFADAFRVGLALNIGGGFAESNGDFAKTENKFNFWGINLYGGWAQNNMAVTADVGYTSTFNDVKQDTPLNLGMSEFKTDMYSYAITAGLRGEYKVQTEYVDIIPHIAARFTSLHSDDYKIKSGGETVFKGEAIDQSIWTFPIGVAFSKDVEMSSGWTFKPQLDLAIIPAAGDIAAKSKVKIPGNSVTADLESNIVDGFSYQGALGFDMYKDNIAFGLNYTIQASEHTTGHGVQATIRYEF